MTLKDLASREDKLQDKVSALYHQPQSEITKAQLQNIGSEYKTIHQEYSRLSSNHIEALKRGLFIQWYHLTEPPVLTCITELDENAENNILDNLNQIITSGEADKELLWMLNYYYKWSWVFERLESFKWFDRSILSERDNQLPDRIDRQQMQRRGQMGKYWNSLTKFSDA